MITKSCFTFCSHLFLNLYWKIRLFCGGKIIVNFLYVRWYYILQRAGFTRVKYISGRRLFIELKKY